PYPTFFFRQAWDLWPDWLLVADDGAIRGYALAAAAARPREAWVLSMAVHPEARGQGLGGALLAQLLTRLRAGGIETAHLTVHPDNPAVRLYRSLGFEETRREADYFQADEPRLLMQCALNGAK